MIKIKQVKLKNFRSYKDEVIVDFENLTAFVGKNDIGKSTILEALDIFFNNSKGVVKLDSSDINIEAKNNNNNEIVITVVFSNLLEKVVIDNSETTILKDEYLLNKDGYLEIIKKYPNAGKENVYLKAYHPKNEECGDLHQKTQKQLQTLVKRLKLEVEDERVNSSLRKSIWSYYKQELKLQEVEIEAKNIWGSLEKYLPIYHLFQADRKNTDGDSEVQDPMKFAVKEIINSENVQEKLNEIANIVKTELNKISNTTFDKLKTIDKKIANGLKSSIPETSSLKWQDVFKNVSVVDNDGVAINKKGSGVKRLVLQSFLMAKAESKNDNSKGVIHAIEEPETSQHQSNQEILINSLKELSKNGKNNQVIITTHSPLIVKKLNFENINIVINKDDIKQIKKSQMNELTYPSLNEINYLAFGYAEVEYHIELFNFIENREGRKGPLCKELEEFCKKEMGEQKGIREYKRKNKNDNESIYKSTYGS